MVTSLTDQLTEGQTGKSNCKNVLSLIYYANFHGFDKHERKILDPCPVKTRPMAFSTKAHFNISILISRSAFGSFRRLYNIAYGKKCSKNNSER